MQTKSTSSDRLDSVVVVTNREVKANLVWYSSQPVVTSALLGWPNVAFRIIDEFQRKLSVFYLRKSLVGNRFTRQDAFASTTSAECEIKENLSGSIRS